MVAETTRIWLIDRLSTGLGAFASSLIQIFHRY
jgi:hypothetical protein